MKEGIKTTWDILKFLIGVVIVAFLLKSFVFQPFVVEGISMEPNYHNNEYLIVNKLVYIIEKPQRGDVMVFRPPDNPTVTYIKRVIGLPGDTVKISQGYVYVNGEKLNEAYLPEGRLTLIGGEKNLIKEVTLASDEYFAMGDNREHSTDSREFGIVPKANIVGKTWIVVYPKQYFGFAQHIVYNLQASN